MMAHCHNKRMKMIPLRRRGWSVIRQSAGTDQGWVQLGKAFPDWDPPRPSATADVHPSDGGDFPQEPPMSAALAFIVIPAKAGIQRQANPAGTARG
jgi:hypothetical protein